MKIMNVIAVYDLRREHVLMCIRSKNPYKGMINFVGGKVEPGEAGLAAAYRELAEEMYKLCAEVAPHLFKHAGPPCAYGACPEGKMSCGKAAEMRARYKAILEKGE